MLIVSDANRAVAGYKAALGAAELWNLGGVAGLVVNGAPFFIHEVNPRIPRRTLQPGRCHEHADRGAHRSPRRLHSRCDRGWRLGRI